MALLDFLKFLPDQLLNPAFPGTPGDKFIQKMQEIGYREYIYQSCSEPAQGEKKWVLVQIFGRILDSFFGKRSLQDTTLSDFIEAMSLRDDDSDNDQEKVQLMTLHASKGLEFPVVLLVGVEEDLLPHRTLGADIDEERRLFYVGITRAQKQLVMSYCRARKRHGQLRPVTKSRFILNLPEELLQEHPSGPRGVNGAARDSMVGDFLSRLQTRLSPPK